MIWWMREASKALVGLQHIHINSTKSGISYQREWMSAFRLAEIVARYTTERRLPVYVSFHEVHARKHSITALTQRVGVSRA